MSNVDTSPRDVKAIIARYRSIGLFGGLFLGAVVGVVIAGPNFRDWSGTRSFLTVFGSIGVGGLIGYIAGEIAVASEASGPGIGSGSKNDDCSGASGGSGDGGGDSE